VKEDNEAAQERIRKQILINKDNCNYLKRQMGEQKRHNLIEENQIIKLNGSNDGIEM